MMIELAIITLVVSNVLLWLYVTDLKWKVDVYRNWVVEEEQEIREWAKSSFQGK